jgi:DNA invertase Pin-like site-specific DNA recombinase
MDFGYIRVSTYDQNMDRQLDGVHLDKIYKDAVSGKDTNRPELQKCISCLDAGDTLHVHSIDRLTRNLRDLLHLLEEMVMRGVTVKFHKEKLTFSSDASPFQTLHLQIIGAVAEFERAFTRERQREGIAIAKAKGKYKGRKSALSDTQVEEIALRLRNNECISHVAREYGISRQTVYRHLRHLKTAEDSTRQACTPRVFSGEQRDNRRGVLYGREKKSHTFQDRRRSAEE